MRALVIGYGSIGERHARLLQNLNVETGVVSQRTVSFPTVFSDTPEALDVFKPEYVVVANKTNEHADTLRMILNNQWKGKVLIEKPVFQNRNNNFNNYRSDIFVGYNLRFHPILQKLKRAIEGQLIISVMAYTGQYLPSWRPNRDYKLSYSSKKEEGGGVLRDLSHELDYLIWMFGKWERLSAIGGRYSSLVINGEDTYGIILSTESCPIVQLQINYLDRLGRREIVVVTDEHTYKVDLINGIYQCDDEIQNIEAERDFTYIEQHKAVLNNDYDNLCTIEEGIGVVELIESIEHSVQIKGWVNHG